MKAQERVELKQVINTEKEYGDKYITIIDTDYSNKLKNTYKPPFAYLKTLSPENVKLQKQYIPKDPLVNS